MVRGRRSSSSSRACARGSTRRRTSCPAASSRWSPSRGRCRATCACCCSTSRSKAWRRRWSRSCSRPSTGCDSELSIVIVEHNLDLVLALADRPTCSSAAASSIRDRRRRCATTSNCAGASSGCEAMERTAAIIGAGLIGRAWAMVFARAGWRVRLYDNATGAARRGARAFIAASLDEQQAATASSPMPRRRSRGSMHAAHLEDALAGVDWVQENLPEVSRSSAMSSPRSIALRAAGRGARELDVGDPGVAVHRGARRARALPRRASGQSAASGAGRRAVRRAVDQRRDHRARAGGV